VTKSRDGKLVRRANIGYVIKGLSRTLDSEQGTRWTAATRPHRMKRVTLSQSERQGKRTGRRMTNDRKHRKACPGMCCWQSQGDSVVEPLFDGRRLTVMGKQLGTCTHRADGVKGGGTLGRNHAFNSGEGLHGPADSAGKQRYKPTGESRGHAVQEVGDGRSTAKREDNTTSRQERAISLDTPRLLWEALA
jgi:hypothetical protein